MVVVVATGTGLQCGTGTVWYCVALSGNCVATLWYCVATGFQTAIENDEVHCPVSLFMLFTMIFMMLFMMIFMMPFYDAFS